MISKLEVRGSYLYPTDSIFREIYSGGGTFSVEANFQAWCGLYPWIGASYFRKTGESIGLMTDTTIQLVPISLGLKYQFWFNRFAPYLGLGALPTYVHMHDKSPFVIRKRPKWGIGGIVKSGIILPFVGMSFLDIFLDYSFIKIDFSGGRDGAITGEEADLSGLNAGAGIGLQF